MFPDFSSSLQYQKFIQDFLRNYLKYFKLRLTSANKLYFAFFKLRMLETNLIVSQKRREIKKGLLSSKL